MKVFFAGSRCAVFDAARDAGMEIVKVLAVPGSALEKRCADIGMPAIPLHSKARLIEEIGGTPFDVLVSNGCPYIIPVSALKKAGQQFVNVHPSLLPNLKGRHPVNGAVLFGLPLGASCHVMDDGIDTGSVIARVHVDADEGADVGLLYRLAFMAEGDAFRLAHARGFVPGSDELRHLSGGGLYFSRTEEVMAINFEDPIELTLRRIAAFAVPGQMARFRFLDNIYTVPRASRVVSDYMERKFAAAGHGTVIFSYDDTLVVKLRDGYLRLSGIDGVAALKEGAVLLCGQAAA